MVYIRGPRGNCRIYYTETAPGNGLSKQVTLNDLGTQDRWKIPDIKDKREYNPLYTDGPQTTGQTYNPHQKRTS